MRLAITMRRIIEPLHGEQRDVLSEDWCTYLYSLWPGLVLLPLMNYSNAVEKWADELEIDGAILSNGNDWGESPVRDNTEARLLAWCRRKSKPILGACRGFQATNVLLGGSIHEDISSVDGHVHGGKPHKVSLTAGPFSLFADDEQLTVNSYHDQGVVLSGLASELQVFAMGAGEVVEAFYHAKEPIIGIQWHPERPSEAKQFNDELIRTFFNKGAFWHN